MENVKAIKAAMAGLVGLLTGLWGWMGWLVIGWIGCMILDYISGTAAAARAGAWSSARARDGIWHKTGMILVVVAAAVADLALKLVLGHLPLVELPFEYAGFICPVVLIWYIITELGSILENAVKMGAPVPEWLVKLLKASLHMVDGAGESAADIDVDKDTDTVKNE